MEGVLAWALALAEMVACLIPLVVAALPRNLIAVANNPLIESADQGLILKLLLGHDHHSLSGY